MCVRRASAQARHTQVRPEASHTNASTPQLCILDAPQVLGGKPSDNAPPPHPIKPHPSKVGNARLHANLATVHSPPALHTCSCGCGHRPQLATQRACVCARHLCTSPDTSRTHAHARTTVQPPSLNTAAVGPQASTPHAASNHCCTEAHSCTHSREQHRHHSQNWLHSLTEPTVHHTSASVSVSGRPLQRCGHMQPGW